jgi:osmotically-inducible protein OsmY
MNHRLRLTPLVLAFAAIAVLALPGLAALPPQEAEVLEQNTIQEVDVPRTGEVPQTAEMVPIVVGPPETVSEAQLKMAVRLALLEHLKDDAFPIKITVDNSSVILTGAVLYRSTQELATEVTKSVPGVYRVHNLIRISPDAPGKGDNLAKRAAVDTGEEVNDAGLETWVKTRLFDAIGRRAFGVEVEVTGGTASLRGTVESAGYKVLAVETAESVKGIWKVIDLIEVRK